LAGEGSIEGRGLRPLSNFSPVSAGENIHYKGAFKRGASPSFKEFPLSNPFISGWFNLSGWRGG